MNYYFLLSHNMMCHCVTHFFTYLLLPLEDVSTQAETETTTNVGSSTVVTSDGLNNNVTTHHDYGLPPGTICNRFCYCLSCNLCCIWRIKY